MIRFGVVGTGTIVEAFIQSARVHHDLSFDAVYSRKQETGKVFADKLGLSKVYTDYKDMLKDETLDAIYIASPNSLHYPQAEQALLSGKHVCVEKPFTGNVDKAKALIALAQDKELILMEAICNIHMPHFALLKKHMDRLGPLKLVHCNYSQYSSRYDALKRGEVTNVFNPAFSGGVLADINIYNVHFVVGLFGAPQGIHYEANLHENGIDLSGVLTLDYGDFKAVCMGAKDSNSRNFGQIQGETGYVYIEGGVNGLDTLEYNTANGQEIIDLHTKPRLYYEVEAFMDMIEHKDFKRRDSYLSESLEVVRVAQEARKQIGLEFEF